MLASIVIITITTSSVYGQTDPHNLERLSLEDLLNVKVTTVSKTSQKAGQAPATVLVVTAEQIKTRGYRNIAQLLNDLPDIKVDGKSDTQSYNTVSIRGIFRQDYFLVLLDGIRISSPTNQSLALLENYPIYLAKQIEVVYGPGSALYGADAMAGVINIITENENNDKVVASSMAGTQGYTSNSLYLNKMLKNNFKLTIAGQYTYDAQPDLSRLYKDAFNMTSHQTGTFNSVYGPIHVTQPIDPRYKAPLKTYNFYASLNKGGFYFKLIRQYAQVPSSTTLNPDNAVYNKDVFYGQGVTVASIGYSDSIGRVKSATSLTGSFFKVNPQSNFRNVYDNMQHGYKYSTGSMQKVEEQLSFAASRQVYLVGGLTYELFQSMPKSPELQSPVNKGNAIKGILVNSSDVYNPSGIEAGFFPLAYSNIGAYLQMQYTPVNKLAITTGLRYDNNSRFGSTFNPRVGAVYNTTNGTTIKAMYGTAYWAPSPQTTFESYGSFYSADSGRTYTSSFWHLPNPGLKPVTSQTGEVSINQKISRKFNVTLTGHYTQIKNTINAISDAGNTNLYNNKFLGWNVGYIEVPFNQGKQVSYGGNLMVNSLFNIASGRFNVYSSLSYVDGNVEEIFAGNKTKRVELPLIAPLQFKFGTDVKWGDFHFSTRLQISGRQRTIVYVNTVDPDKRKTTNGYTLLNASGDYTIKGKITFFTSIENVFNKRYSTPLPVDPNNTSSPEFAVSYQDPIRAMVGVRLTLQK